ncbi:MAG: Zn-dependent alcohol dehydrogenase [Verrucomicrobiales bacterium]|nr:Zn-dependent alcohol dehydrogenase [Verrucomicrobiales bacterium]|tara:strand:+ start:31 stop:1131 length:1101 start_codon:yes stop_codon:yes gene_type:complete
MNSIPREMKAVVYRGKRDLRVETVPVPRISAHDILVRVGVCGVCPTDIKKIHHATVAPPRIFGHETAGTIVKVGAKVHGFRVGDRVGLHHHVPCLNCHACGHRAFAQCPQYKRTGITAGFEPAGGGYAEYVRVMSFCLPGVVKIPRRNALEEGAMLEPVNTVLKAVKRLNILTGDRVLVAGQGPIGLMFTKLLSLQGIKVIATDLMSKRLRLAKQFGASKTIRANAKTFDEQVRRATRGKGLDASVVAVPVDALVQQSMKHLRGAGQVMLFAHTKRGAQSGLDLAEICVDEKDLIGSYSSDFTLQGAVAKLVFSRQFDVRALISHRFPLEQTAQAVELAANPTPESLKIVVTEQDVEVSAEDCPPN